MLCSIACLSENSFGIEAVGSEVKSKFAEIISIEINTGPRTKHVQEIDSVDLLRGSWISKRQLRCTDRLLHNIEVDKPVGRCFLDVHNIRAVHEGVLRKCKITVRISVQNLNKKLSILLGSALAISLINSLFNCVLYILYISLVCSAIPILD